jgi:hypothetical protein
VTPSKVARDTLKLFQGQADDRGPQGTTGPQGIQGPKGDPGPPGQNATAATIDGVAAGGGLAGSYPDPAIAAGSVGPAQIGTTRSVRVTGSSDEPIASGDSPTTLTFDRTLYDNASIHRTTAPSRLIAPIAGVYEIVGEAAWDASPSGDRKLTIRRNSSDVADGFTAADPTTETSQQIVLQAHLNAGDFVELAASQTSGDNLSILALTGPPDPALEMHWLGP